MTVPLEQYFFLKVQRSIRPEVLWVNQVATKIGRSLKKKKIKSVKLGNAPEVL